MNAPKTVTKTMWVASKQNLDGGYDYWLTQYDMSEYGDIMLGQADVTFIVPETDPVQAEVEGLQSVKDKMNLEHATKMKQIEDRINSLLAIEHKGE